MLKLNLREVAKELDVAIGCFDEALKTLVGLEDSTVTDEHRKKFSELSRKCMKLKALRDETDIMMIERSLHLYNVQEATEKISGVYEELKDARSLIKI